ncbi:hypothetical protein [Butyrivibrio sp. MC2013]|uniref:hypothetical protein n=1 Tax=Butyrivibrio sp. MC2013 TaxID=1280686 RepID=UPI00040B0F44|nr:hypothetical protein [Butyrivibrio sp. MC2013]
MNISFNNLNSYIPYNGNNNIPGSLNARDSSLRQFLPAARGENADKQNAFSSITDRIKNDKEKNSRQMRNLIRDIKKSPAEQANPYSATIKDKENGFLQLSGAPEAENEDENDEPVKYSSREVESKIQRAKSSTSAGLAVIAAKRKVSEVKRQMARGDGDPEELQMALNHAKGMERVAKKKKHHLELEELVENTGKRDEKLRGEEQTASQLENMVISACEDKLAKAEEELAAEQEEMISAAIEEMKEQGEEITKEALADLNDMVSEMTKETMDELEENMEILELMEVVDPHMSKEDLEDLKRKHRASEEKEMVKLDMDYLKAITKHELEKAAEGRSPASGSGTHPMPAMPFGSFTGAVASSGFSAGSGGAVDVQV